MWVRSAVPPARDSPPSPSFPFRIPPLGTPPADGEPLDLILRCEYFVRGSTLRGRECSPSLVAPFPAAVLPPEGGRTAVEESGLAEPQLGGGRTPEEEEEEEEEGCVCGCW